MDLYVHFTSFLREQIMRKNDRTGKRLRLIPLILGGYGAFLGLGLAAIGFAELREVIGMIRLLVGLGMAGFGALGIWDGVRDLVRPVKKPEQASASQFILTDASGNRSSIVTVEVLEKQLESLIESDKGEVFNLQILPPFAVQEIGNVSQIFCMHHQTFGLTAFLDVSEGGYESYHKSASFDEAKGWFEQLLTGSADLSGWKKMENASLWEEYGDEDACSAAEDAGWEEGIICLGSVEDSLEDMDETAGFDEPDSLVNTEETAAGKRGTDTRQVEERIKSFWYQFQREQKGQMRGWHQFLVIFGENWHDEHKFFSARDVELTIEGIHEGKYTKAVLEWGTITIDLFPGVQNDLMVIWCTNNVKKEEARFLAKEGTVTQVKFWLVSYLNSGIFDEMSGWVDITDRMEL